MTVAKCFSALRFPMIDFWTIKKTPKPFRSGSIKDYIRTISIDMTPQSISTHTYYLWVLNVQIY
jgi:hypothetical protein